MKEFGKRFFSGLIGILLLLFIVSKGGYYLLFSIYIISIVGLREFYRTLENISIRPLYPIGYLGTTAFLIGNLLKVDNLNLIIVTIVILALILIIFNRRISLQDISLTIIGVLYIPFMLFHIMYLDKSNYIWLIFIIAFGTDTFAYIAGNLFGRHKLCPNISPKKTIEGSIGGVLGSVLLVVIYSTYFHLTPMWSMIILSIVSSIIAQLGDLTASKIKRLSGVKDYGSIMPGHGGVLDRFDSIIFVSPVIYYYISSFIY